MADPGLVKTLVAHTAGLRHTCAHILARVIFRPTASASAAAGYKILEVGPGKRSYRADRRRWSGNLTRREIATYRAERRELTVRIAPEAHAESMDTHRQAREIIEA